MASILDQQRSASVNTEITMSSRRLHMSWQGGEPVKSHKDDWCWCWNVCHAVCVHQRSLLYTSVPNTGIRVSVWSVVILLTLFCFIYCWRESACVSYQTRDVCSTVVLSPARAKSGQLSTLLPQGWHRRITAATGANLYIACMYLWTQKLSQPFIHLFTVF